MSNVSCVGNYWYTNNINLSFSWLQWNVKHEIITIILGLQWNQGLIKILRAQLLCVVFLSPIQYSLFVCAIQMSKLIWYHHTCLTWSYNKKITTESWCTLTTVVADGSLLNMICVLPMCHLKIPEHAVYWISGQNSIGHWLETLFSHRS